MRILKALKHKSCLSLGTCHKHVAQLTEPTSTTEFFWYAKRNKLTSLSMPVLNTVELKQCCCI